MKDYMETLRRNKLEINQENWLDLVREAGWAIEEEVLFLGGVSGVVAMVLLEVPSSSNYTRITHPFRGVATRFCDIDIYAEADIQAQKASVLQEAWLSMWSKNSRYIVAGLVNARDVSYRMKEFRL